MKQGTTPDVIGRTTACAVRQVDFRFQTPQHQRAYLQKTLCHRNWSITMRMLQFGSGQQTSCLFLNNTFFFM